MTNFDRIKKMLNGSTTMPQGTSSNNVHYHNGVACTHDHSHDEQEDHKHDPDRSCCDSNGKCSK